jgi:hypothetical protein
VLAAVDRAHSLVCPLQPLVLLLVLPALEPVEEVVPERLVEVQADSCGDFGRDPARTTGQPHAKKGETARYAPLLLLLLVLQVDQPFVEDDIDIRDAWQGDEL